MVRHRLGQLVRYIRTNANPFVEKNKFQDKLLAEEAAEDTEENGATVDRKEEGDTDEKMGVEISSNAAE